MAIQTAGCRRTIGSIAGNLPAGGFRVSSSIADAGNEFDRARDARYVPRPEVEALIRDGNKRMREGDILGARQSYQKAVAFGDAAAALVMGRSYDPIYFAKIAGRNAEPEPAKAFEWYRRAMDAGAAQTAMVRIGDLKRFVSEQLSESCVPASSLQWLV